MKKKVLCPLIITTTVVGMIFVGCGQSDVNQTPQPAESVAAEAGMPSSEDTTFSCVGSWSDGGSIQYVLEEGGTGSLIQAGTLTNNDTGETSTTQQTSSVTWEDKGDMVNISGYFGSYDYEKAIEDGKECLKTEKVTYYRTEAEEIDGINGEKNDSSLQTIPFEMPVVYEDENLKVELVKFYEDEVRWAGQTQPAIEKYVTFKVTNKSEDEFLFYVKSAYLNDEEVRNVMCDGNSGPLSGKAKEFSYNIQYNTSPDATPLDSIDELYGLEGEFRICLEEDDYIVDDYEVDFSLKDLDL